MSWADGALLEDCFLEVHPSLRGLGSGVGSPGVWGLGAVVGSPGFGGERG